MPEPLLGCARSRLHGEALFGVSLASRRGGRAIPAPTARGNRRCSKASPADPVRVPRLDEGADRGVNPR
jgi:hypothetical protein